MRDLTAASVYGPDRVGHGRSAGDRVLIEDCLLACVLVEAYDAVLADIRAERAAQVRQWGVQNHPDGTGPSGAAAADQAKRDVAEAMREGGLTWRHILHEEVLEAFAEDDPVALRAELVQVAAVAAEWIRSLDDRAPAKTRFRAIVDVHVVLTNPSGEILLLRRANTGYKDGQWHLPSGHLESGESVIDAAVREAREEVGVTIAPESLTFAHVMHRAPERIGLFFATETWTGTPHNAEPDKCSEIAWYALDALPPDTIDYPAAALAAITGRQPFALHDWP